MMTTALALLLFSNQFFGQKKSIKDCLISYLDSTSGKVLMGYKSLKGEIIIKAKYLNGSGPLCEMAFVINSEYELVGIDRNDSILLKPYIYDNGPDYEQEGLFKNKKMKRKITYGLLTILLLGGLCFGLNSVFGLFTDFNSWTAGQDIENGKIQIVEIGEMPLNFEEKQKLASSYGFNFYLFGCNVSTATLNGTEYYNKKMIHHLEIKYGLAWWTKFQSQLDSIDNSDKVPTQKPLEDFF
ncbi:hypothetical protein FNW52_18610 [Flavobacterium sp. ZT3R18]|nr:hypothetical protein [Flavobacterium sp. ZT3R18]TRX31661.1 hypothetical protein FNW52_18610 [Flavobacterium sp. ZT3R18]